MADSKLSWSIRFVHACKIFLIFFLFNNSERIDVG